MCEKYLIMSLDDGTEQDKKVISILKKYGLTATFNLNSGKLGAKEEIPIMAYDGKPLRHDKVSVELVQKGLYNGFEVACHGFSHAHLPELKEFEMEREIYGDYDELTRLTGIKPMGIAYAGPTPNYNDKVVNILKGRGKLYYGRTVDETHGFAMPKDFLKWNPTCQFRGEELLVRAKEFFDFKPEKNNALFFVWGHSYEFDLGTECWNKLEYFCNEISKRNDINCLTCADFYARFGKK